MVTAIAEHFLVLATPRAESLATCEGCGNVEMTALCELIWMSLCSLPDPGPTLACHRIAALCVMLLHADFGVEIAGTMWIVLSVFSEIRITMAFAQLTHSHSLITCPVFLCLSDHISCVSITCSDRIFTQAGEKMMLCVSI